ncbi:MAG TPA: diguanylate cyclase [Anaerolineae bacterium]|nr:diguanylate cyclase [Anaerolineae bacterium]
MLFPPPTTSLSQNALKWLSQYAVEGVFTTDLDLNLTAWNHWLVEHTNKPSAMILGRHLYTLYPSIPERNLDQKYQLALNGQPSILAPRFHNYLIPIERQGQSAHKFMQQRVHIAPLIDDNHNIVGTITLIENATEDIERINELHQQIRLLESFNKISHTILQLDLSECLNSITTALTLLQPDTITILLHQQNHWSVATHIGYTTNYEPQIDLNKGDHILTYTLQQQTLVHIRDRQKQAIQGFNANSRTLVGVPLAVQAETIGLIIIESNQSNAFQHDNIALIENIALQAAISIQNARLYEQIKQDAQRIAMMRTIEQAILSADSPKAIATAALNQIQQILPPHESIVFTFDHQHQQATLLASTSTDKSIQPQYPLISFGDLQHLRQKQLHLTHIDTPTTTTIRAAHLPPSIWPQHRTLLQIPLIAHQELIGVLALAALPSDAFDPNQQQIVQQASNSLAITVHQARLYEQMHQLATTDELTGLNNRRHFFRLAQQCLIEHDKTEQPVSLIMLDIDHFKRINDTHGHAMGDEVLRQVAQCFRDVLRPTDIIGRYGGEEFTILLPNTPLRQAQKMAEELRQTVAVRPFKTGTAALKATISLGLTTYSPPMTLDSLLDQADQALYKAKSNGRNQTVIR